MTDVLEALTVRPGDTLVVRVRDNLTIQQADELKAAIEERMPGVKTILLAAEQIAVYKPEVAAP